MTLYWLSLLMQRRIYMHDLSGWWQTLDPATGIGGGILGYIVRVEGKSFSRGSR